MYFSTLYTCDAFSDIDKIDMSRENYSYKISDVGLLSLGQRSSSLRSLVLNGCDHISDVGINWLAEGCNALEQLELCGCTKLTDAGLRSLSHNCHSLNKLDISHAQLVSDVGMASIASGCPGLKTIKCHGMFYLSDPRIEPPKKKDENKRMSNLTKPKGSSRDMKDDKLDGKHLRNCISPNLIVQIFTHFNVQLQQT